MTRQTWLSARTHQLPDIPRLDITWHEPERSGSTFPNLVMTQIIRWQDGVLKLMLRAQTDMQMHSILMRQLPGSARSWLWAPWSSGLTLVAGAPTWPAGSGSRSGTSARAFLLLDAARKQLRKGVNGRKARGDLPFYSRVSGSIFKAIRNYQ